MSERLFVLSGWKVLNLNHVETASYVSAKKPLDTPSLLLNMQSGEKMMLYGDEAERMWELIKGQSFPLGEKK